MMKSLFRIICLSMLLTLTGLGIAQESTKVQLEGDPARRKHLEKIQGKPAPPLEIETWIGSKPIKLSDLKGKVVMLDFWGTW
jgi:hypothetical protein